MRLARSSARLWKDGAVLAACATLGLGGVACGGGAASPTPTVAVVGSSPVPSASPQRPALSSPLPSPSTAAGAVNPTSTTADVSGSSESYEVQSGDTLATIAEHVYGDATQWRRIYDANKDVIGADADKLKLGMRLKIPPKQ